MKYILLYIFLVLNVTISAQLYCTNYDVKDGLPSENITAIAEDSDGYIYVGTSIGLSYFDGISFRTVSDEGQGDVPNNVFVEAIRFDNNDNLWVSTERNGLFRLEPQSNTWINFSMDALEKQQLPNNGIWEIEVVDDHMFVGCEHSGILTIDINTLEVAKCDNFQNQTIRDIFLEDPGSLLITTRQSVIRVESLLRSSIKDTIYHGSPDIDLIKSYTLSDHSINTISYTKGIFKVENNNLVSTAPPEGLDTWVYNYIDEHEEKQWLTLKNTGVASIDIKTGEWKIYESQPYSKSTLPKGKYNAGFKDSRDVLWIATSKGLSSINPELQAFRNIDNDIPTNEFMVDAIYDEVRKQYVMLYASEENKVKFFDEQFNEIAAYNHTPTVRYIQSLWSLIPYEGDYFCLGHNIMFIDGETGVAEKANFLGFSNIKNPRAITLDKENNLWIAHDGNKLVQYSLEKDEILTELTLPLLDKPSDVNFRVSRIKDCGHYISVVARDVFMMVNKYSKQIDVYDVDITNNTINKIDKYPLKVGSIMQVEMYNDSYFVCTRDEGIYMVDLSIADSKFTVTSSLPPSEVYGPVELAMDDQNDIWIATDNGLVLTDENLNIKKKINGQQGLPNTKLSEGLSIANGNVILNNRNGITIADTTILKNESKISSVDIQSILVNNERVGIDNKGLQLKPEQKNIQINVSMPYYGSRSDFSYLYRLLPTTKEWNEVNSSQSLFRFDNLVADNYTFEIKSTLGQSESEVSRISFTINPPFWKTWWFVLLTFLLLLGLGTWAYKARVRNKVNQEKIKTKLAELQNEAIRAQLNPHFIFNALNSIRSLILMDKKEGSLNYLGRFSTLVREVLSISKEEAITLSRELEFNENYVNIERLRFSQSLIYDVKVAEGVDVDQVKVPPMVMQPFIENAIWHGLLGKVENAMLSVGIKKEGNSLIISIDDNGTGRQEKKEKQTKYKTRKSFGELLSKQRLQSIGDGAEFKILDKVENGRPSGTTVIIKLPLQL